MSDIDQQAREYANEALNLGAINNRIPFVKGFLAGAHRTPSDDELEEAKRNLISLFKEFAIRDGVGEKITFEETATRILDTVLRSLGMTVR